MPAPITLLTDFGTLDGYVAQMKGVILSMAPQAVIVDVTHAIGPGEIRQGGLALEQVIDAFPPATIHVAVVDPGVGSQRGLVGLESAGQRFLAPDNGLLGEIVDRRGATRVHRLEVDRFWRRPVSSTFHGRDVLSPVAAHWLLGADLAEFGAAVDARDLIRLAIAAPCRIEANTQSVAGWAGEVIAADRFGNLMTNLRGEHLGEFERAVVVVTGPKGPLAIAGVSRFYAQQPSGALMALVGSSGRLEVAVNGGSALERLGAGVGTSVRVHTSGGNECGRAEES